MVIAKRFSVTLDAQDKLTISAKRAGLGGPNHDDTPVEETVRNPEDEHEYAGAVLEPPSRQLHGHAGAAVIHRSPVRKAAGTFTFTPAIAHSGETEPPRRGYGDGGYAHSGPDQPSLRSIFRATTRKAEEKRGSEETVRSL